MIYASERDLERVQIRRGEYAAEIVLEIVGHLKFLDEAGSNLAMTRLYGRAVRGERVYVTVPSSLFFRIYESGLLPLMKKANRGFRLN